MHICLDNVYYPLDFSKLGIAYVDLPIGLRFSLSDGLFPTPNREQLIYSSHAKKTILNKINIVIKYFVDKYNENSIECTNIQEIFNYYSDSTRNVTIGNTVIDASKLAIFEILAFHKPTFKKYPLTDFKNLFRNKDYLFYEYKIHIEYSRGQFKQTSNSYRSTNLGYNDIKKNTRIFIYDALFVGNKKSYIKSLLPPNSYEPIRFVKKQYKFTLRNKNTNQTYDNYTNLLELRKYPKDTWRARIQEFQAILKELTAKFEFVDDMVIPQPWLDARKKKRVYASGGAKRTKLQGASEIC
jgi:hypothetical protein